MVILNNVIANPNNSPCFTYQTKSGCQHVRDGRRRDAQRPVAAKDHFSKTFQQATKNPAERVAPEHLPCLEHGEHRRQQPAAADAANHKALLP
jgi:hypothetical protein